MVLEKKSTTTTATSDEGESVGLTALRAVFAAMQEADGTAVTPVALTRTLGIPHFEQQDSQEFWKLLLPVLEAPQLTDLYQGAFEDYIVAQDGSGRQRRREEAFLDISLDVTDQGSVMSSLKTAFGQAELLSVAEGNGWRPSKGEDKVDALKGCQLKVQGLPPILQLHLKRFTYDWNRDVMEKSNVPFHFDAELDLTALCQNATESDDTAKAPETGDIDESAIYDLQAVVIHVGQYNVGHYYAYVRPNVDENRWFRINDDEIDEVTFEQVLADGVGGKADNKNGNGSSNKRGLFQRLAGIFGGGSNAGSFDGPFGFGGSTANAYVLQYVKRSERQRLYNP